MPNPRSQRYSFFSPRGFIVLGFTFKSILYFGLVFVYGTRHGLKFIFLHKAGLPTWLSGRESVCQCRIPKRRGFNPWVGKIPWSRKWQHTQIFLPEKFHRQRSLVGYSPWGCKEPDTTEQLSMHAQDRYISICVYI